MKIRYSTLTALFVIALCISVNAQRAKVVSAFQYLKYGELDKAKEAIDETTQHDKSKDLAKTWYYRAKIYHAIYDSKDPAVNALDPNSLNVAYKAYLKADSLDDKGQYTDEMNKKLEIAATQFVNKGVREYAEKDFTNALTSFEYAIAINKLPVFNKVDTLSMYNASLTSEKLEKYEKAKGYYQELIEYNYGGSKIYSFLLNIYKREENAEAKIDIIKKGREAYPDDNNLIIEELNYYISTGDKDKAIGNLELAVQKDPGNYNLYYALGSMYDQINEFAKGEETYQKAFDLAVPDYQAKRAAYNAAVGTETEAMNQAQLNSVRETYFSILYNFGALYFNEGVKILKEINTIVENVRYAKEKDKAEEIMVKALPFLESALKIKPNDRNTLTSLRDLYARTGDNANWEKMQQQLEN
ncbi:MAG TPA: hypothetical protein EYN38_03305 [Flavobacteriales bacterium]|nr:hypothetical protein [Flavobacteriales bacterium]